MSYNHALDRLLNLGLPNEVAKPILLNVKQWIRACGPEWTVARLKELKTWYIHKLSGQEFRPTTWIAEKDGNPRGCFKPIFRMKPGARVFNALMIYTGFTLNKVSVKQKQKFFTSVVSEDIPIPFMPRLKDVVSSVNNLLPQRKITSLEEYPFSELRRAPLGKTRTAPEGPHMLFEDVKSKGVCDILEEYDISPQVGRSWLRLLQSPDYDTVADETVGRISVVQEPGCKARFLANPKRIFQVALRPLGRQLLGLLERLPWDCTHRQLEGVDWVRTQLALGKTVHSVDLSDATNNFPLSLQMRVLGWLEGLDKQDLDLFHTVSRGSWYIPPELRPIPSMETLRWTKGQPLGLYPSFMAFAFTHGCLVKSIEVITKRYDTFRVLGDDIVISDDEVARIYRSYLDLLQIPISQSKTIVSDKVAEFAGMLITRKACYVGSKWRTPGFKNMTSLLATLPRELNLGKRAEFTAFLFKSAPRPYGLGVNPEGLPLETRCQLFLPWYLKTLDDTCSLERTPYDAWLYKLPAPEQKCTLMRSGVQSLTSGIICRWDDEHPWTPLADDVNSNPDQRLPELWKRLVQYFRFKSIDPPPELRSKSVEWLLSSGLGYLRQVVERQIISKPSSCIGQMLYNLQYKHQVNYLKMGRHARELWIHDVALKYLEQ